MKELFLETPNGRVPIDKSIVEKYNIKEGVYSPFTRCRIVDKSGVFYKDIKDKTDTDISQMPEGEGMDNDNVVEFPEGESYSTAEIIELHEATDSTVMDGQ